ncbi:MAG: hypothetical protein ABI551_16900 [Polyangiaceae bacterium]
MQLSEVDIIDVDLDLDSDADVDDQAKTSALEALSPAAAASALAKLEGKDANCTQEIDFGDVLEVTSKLGALASTSGATSKSSSKSVAPRPSSSRPVRVAPPSDMAISAVVIPAPASAPQLALPSVMVHSPDATAEIRPGDVLEEIVVENAPVPASVATPVSHTPPQTLTFTPPATNVAPSSAAGPARLIPQHFSPDASIPIPAAEISTSDIAKTNILPPKNGRQHLAQFASGDDEVAPLTSDTSEIAIDGIAGMPLWVQLKNKPQFMVVGGAVSACLAIGVLALGIHVFGGSKGHDATASTSSQSTTTVTAAASPMSHDDPSAAIPPPPEQEDAPTVSIDDLKKDGKPSLAAADAQQWSPAPGAHPHPHHADTSSAPPPAHAMKTRSSSSKPKGFGLIRTWIAARGEPIAVDGKVLGIAPSPVRVACGPHKVAIGKEVVHADIPCDGAVTVGSPDHTKQ